MKRVLFFAFVVVLAFASCKSKKVAQSSYNTDTTPRVFSVPGTTTSTSQPAAVNAATTESPVSMRSEQISFMQQEDRIANESNSFFVILGSFSQLENARNFRETLIREGFTPIILHSETGNYRVCVNSYRGEQEARSRVAQIRQAYPRYSDVWLLIRR